ncbi:HNH endonuclease [Ancylobacter defluvii]|nr:HNH endonuclease [Ancylobacter defluvii]
MELLRSIRRRQAHLLTTRSSIVELRRCGARDIDRDAPPTKAPAIATVLAKADNLYTAKLAIRCCRSEHTRGASRLLAPSPARNSAVRSRHGIRHSHPPTDTDLPPNGFSEEQAPFAFEESREHVSYLSSRIVRNRVFRRIVLHAYDERCAISGLKLINGGGRAEVAAAHIQPVQANGPDIVSNGLALSGTAHWMFDRGMISLTDDLDVLISRHANDPDGVRAFINRSGRAIAPQRAFERPHPHFLRWHREHCFKQ